MAKRLKNNAIPPDFFHNTDYSDPVADWHNFWWNIPPNNMKEILEAKHYYLLHNRAERARKNAKRHQKKRR